MKNKRLLIIGLILALLMTGVAYAAWTDDATITVAAETGEMNVIISNAAAGTPSNAVITTTATVVDEENAAVTITNLYPGATAEFTITMENDGTIPVDLLQIVHTAGDVVDINGSTINHGVDAALYAELDLDYYINDGTGDVAFTSVPSDGSPANFASSTITSLDAGDTFTIRVVVSLDSGADDSCQNKQYNLVFTPQFEQS